MSHAHRQPPRVVGGFLLLLAFPALVRADSPASPPPMITVRAVRPDLELAAVIRLFDGSRAASPAAALSAWKRASAEPKRLGKVAEAAIAILNPHMIPEFRLLDAAEVAFNPVPDSSRWDWRVGFPNDDGTLAAVIPTAALSGGRADLPAGTLPVIRFPGASPVLVSRGPAGLVAASSREQLLTALTPGSAQTTSLPIDSGYLVRIDPSAGGTSTSLAGRRWTEAARVTGCELISGQVGLRQATLVATWIGRFHSDTPIVAPIDPEWLDPIPTRGPLAAFGLRVDPRAESWKGFFDFIDRIERVDPERAKVASSRIRLAIAAQVVGVRLEVDVWPHLRGVSGWVGVAGAALDRGLVALHLDDEAAARRLTDGVKGSRVQDGPDVVIGLRPVAGRPLRLVRRRAVVFLAWGEATWGETKAALDHPERSSRPWLGTSRTGALPSRVGAIWPDQIPGIEAGTPLAASLAASPPIRWAGTNEANRSTDEFWVEGLDATIRRFLDQIPLDRPPDP